LSTIQTRRWTRLEYEKMGDAGVFLPGERVELIDGEILEVTPQKRPHGAAVTLVGDALRIAFGSGFHVQIQLPLALDPYSEPEPDVAVIPGSPRDYRESHPTSAGLVVEVADASLEHDRKRKGSLYARSGLSDYWVLNLLDRCLEVYRDPIHDPAAPHGWSYRTVQRFGAADVVSPIALPHAQVRVEDLLP
jgi:Uma2 family endonuclease